MTIVTVTETKTYTIDWRALSKGVEKLVMEKLKQDLANWKNDISMKQMFVQDCADSLAVCETMRDGRWRDVENRLGDMDTAARDAVYDLIAEVGRRRVFRQRPRIKRLTTLLPYAILRHRATQHKRNYTMEKLFIDAVERWRISQPRWQA